MPSADKGIIREFIGKTSLPRLSASLKDHLKETKDHVRKLEKVFKSIGKASRSIHSKEIERVLDEGSEMIGEAEGPELIDAIVIAAAQKVERFEITSYGTLCAWAKSFGEAEIHHDDPGHGST
jgi:ferritin-like metal-binding protein YciE